ncbi:hypothetical protein [Nonomuraea sp. NPDC049309]|uniref:hypothetical protein n=1 Tax=Nonomuraea sp. NPDC049309 TaxID=3364350 RepID=UPI003710E7DD
MIRRILAGAAVAAAAFGFAASAASADVGPNAHNRGASLASQFQVVDDLLNNVGNHSLNNLELRVLSALDEVNVSLLNNNQPQVNDRNFNTRIDNGGSRAQ